MSLDPAKLEFRLTGVGPDCGHLQAQGPKGDGRGLEVALQGGSRCANVAEEGVVGFPGAADEDRLGVGAVDVNVCSCHDGVVGDVVRDWGSNLHDSLTVHCGIYWGSEGGLVSFGGPLAGGRCSLLDLAGWEGTRGGGLRE